MAHVPTSAIARIRDTYCARHQTTVAECARDHRPAAMAAGATVFGSLGYTIGKGRGAAIGSLAGLAFGYFYPELAQPERLLPLARAMHG